MHETRRYNGCRLESSRAFSSPDAKDLCYVLVWSIKSQTGHSEQSNQPTCLNEKKKSDVSASMIVLR